MAELNIFKADGFSTMEVSAAIDQFDSVPTMLGSMNIFTPKPVRQKDIFLEVRDSETSLLGIVERGAPLNQYQRDTRKKVGLTVPKIGQQETLWGHELAGIRAFGSQTEEMAVSVELGRRLQALKNNVAYTKEYMRLAAVQGRFLNPAGGSTVYNYYTELGIAEAPAVSFELDVATTKVKELAEALVISIQRASRGAWIAGQTKVHAIVGDNFWFALTQHPNVEKYYNNWSAAAELKNLDASTEFEFGGIRWHRYIGSDDNTEIAVLTNEAKFFPVGAPDVFQEIMAPADEFIGYIGTPGQSIYALKREDKEYEMPRFVGYDVVSYPLFVCNRPNMLRKGTLT